MHIHLTDSQINVIKIWADTTIHGGHWGDGDFMVPEESIILNKIENSDDGHVSLTSNEVRIILAWSESSHGIHTLEEESTIQKLKLVVAENT
jgi:hypothetical protein